MPSLWPNPGGIYASHRIRSALAAVADEVCATLARLIAYVLTLAMLGILALAGWNQLPHLDEAEPAAIAGWTAAGRSQPAYAVSPFDMHAKSNSYEIFRHPDGGRKDVVRWADQTGRPVAELEIYRLGGEADVDAAAGLAARMPPAGSTDLEAAGVIDSKLGPFALLRPVGRKDAPGSCLGFVGRINDPALRISGWSCQGDSLPIRRATIGCLLNHLTLIASGNDPKLAEFFARAELKRGGCAGPVRPGESVDWVSRNDNPRLRGTF
jgi:hypothetical protein